MKELKTKVSRRRQKVFEWSLSIDKDIEISYDGHVIYAPEEVVNFISRMLNDNIYKTEVDVRISPNVLIKEDCLIRTRETSRSQELIIRIYKINYVFE